MMWFAFAWLATCVLVFSVAALAPLFRMTEEDADEADALVAMRKKGGAA